MAHYSDLGDSSSSSDPAEEVSNYQESLLDEALQACIVGDDISDDVPREQPAVVAARAYQLEMLEESLKQNIIVAVCSVSELP